MKRKVRILTEFIWVLMISCAVLLTIKPPLHYDTFLIITSWWAVLAVCTAALVLGWIFRNQPLGKVILSVTIAVAVVFGLAVLLVALFAEQGWIKALLGLFSLAQISAGTIWYATVYERRNQLLKRKF